MKTLGLIGGMSWESTAIYYRLINEATRARLGGLHSARLLMWSFDFAPIAKHQMADAWDELATVMVDAARRLEGAGADALLICTNTMHRLFEKVQVAVAIPVLHIADVTAAAMAKKGCRRPIVLATRFTMEQRFYTGRLLDRHGIEAIVPDEAGRSLVHDIIYRELCQGIVQPQSKQAYLAEIARLSRLGADSVVLGCTEIGMLIGQQDLDLPLFDTTQIHADAAVAYALGG
ncbi:aspartate/glutamate racemase family protein [Labrys sp. KNU-23]|uniref:aspartate/glutamate racemase family protein n=1 Tax=Labrys sp. KNU-23 TaxID=2789216 RepID=UPI0011EF43C4|nr:aspartate/glutamate racemase family protein [Labrys sp. KNU-23]QEN90096.1 aspartate/glutamate racemase family protein [Labrys sp. KNU-23]